MGVHTTCCAKVTGHPTGSQPGSRSCLHCMHATYSDSGFLACMCMYKSHVSQPDIKLQDVIMGGGERKPKGVTFLGSLIMGMSGDAFND